MSVNGSPRTLQAWVERVNHDTADDIQQQPRQQLQLQLQREKYMSVAMKKSNELYEQAKAMQARKEEYIALMEQAHSFSFWKNKRKKERGNTGLMTGTMNGGERGDDGLEGKRRTKKEQQSFFERMHRAGKERYERLRKWDISLLLSLSPSLFPSLFSPLSLSLSFPLSLSLSLRLSLSLYIYIYRSSKKPLLSSLSMSLVSLKV